MPTAITTKQIVEEYGKYYENAGQNKNRLKSALVQPPVTLERYAQHIRTNETIYRMGNFAFQSLIQPFKKTFDPNGNIEFFPNELRLYEMKADIEIYPHDIEASYLGFLAGDSSRNIKDWPIIRFIMEEYIAKQIGADRENKMVYKAKYNPEGTNPEDCMDGIKELLLKGVEAKYPINTIAGVGQLSEEKIFDQVEAFDEGLPELYNEQMVIIFMAPKWVRAYKKNKRSNNFYFVQSEKEIDEQIDFSKHYICPLPSMSGTDDMWGSVKDNILWGTKREGNLANANVQAFDRSVHITLDWWEGIQFFCNQMVWVAAETVGQESSTTNTSGDVEEQILTVMTDAAEQVVDVTAILKGKISGIADLSAAVFGFVYGTTNKPATAVVATLSAGVLSANLTGLTAATKYYCRATVKIGNDTYKGDLVDFTTAVAVPADPTCVTTPASDVVAAGATLNASYVDEDTVVTGGGFEYGTSVTGTLTNVTNAPAAGSNSKAITGLTAATAYVYRAYVLVGTKKFYGGWSAFTTLAGE